MGPPNYYCVTKSAFRKIKSIQVMLKLDSTNSLLILSLFHTEDQIPASSVKPRDIKGESSSKTPYVFLGLTGVLNQPSV